MARDSLGVNKALSKGLGDLAGGTLPPDEARGMLGKPLQFALRLEFATIPPYLAAAYSLRNNNERIRHLILRIAREEMLHMTAVANIKVTRGQVSLLSPGLASHGLSRAWREGVCKARDLTPVSQLLELVPATASATPLGTGGGLRAPAELLGAGGDVAFQVWRGRELVAATDDAPRRPLRGDFTPGFESVEIDGKAWRVYAVSDRTGQVQIQVGNSRALIDAAFQHRSFRIMAGATIPLVFAGFLMWWSVRRALEPLAAIEAAARQRSQFDLTPLPMDKVPAELRPLIESFNHLLARLNHAIESERRFIGDAAHELRTPLSALQAQVEVAIMAGTDASRQAALEKLRAAVQRSSRLAEQLLDLARTEAGSHGPQRDWYDLSEIIRHVASEFEIAARHGRRHVELVVDPCDVHCDIDEIGILVRNLVDNALRYTLVGGTVRISCGHLADGAGGHPWLEVTDDGPGVPADAATRIFERFERFHHGSGTRGSGIGLSLVARVAALHDARIETGGGIGERGFSIRVLFPGKARGTLVEAGGRR